MIRAYVVFAILVCGVLAYANYNGWSVADSVASGHWTPRGRSAFHK